MKTAKPCSRNRWELRDAAGEYGKGAPSSTRTCPTCEWPEDLHGTGGEDHFADILIAARVGDHLALAAAAADIARLRSELDRHQRWVTDLQSGMYVNCVYCGHRYGPAGSAADAVPRANETMAQALTRHVAECPQHPLAGARALLTQWLDWPGRTNDDPDPIEIATAAFLGHKPDCERVEYGVCTCGLAPEAEGS